jgi:hypothetical protein
MGSNRGHATTETNLRWWWPFNQIALAIPCCLSIPQARTSLKRMVRSEGSQLAAISLISFNFLIFDFTGVGVSQIVS